MKRFTVKQRPASEVEDLGFKKFNDCHHMCVEVPDGNSTITCKLSDGTTATLAFCAYKKDKAPGCLDVKIETGIKEHEVPRSENSAPGVCHGQGIIIFGDANVDPKPKDIRIKPKQAYGLTTFLLKQHYE